MLNTAETQRVDLDDEPDDEAMLRRAHGNDYYDEVDRFYAVLRSVRDAWMTRAFEALATNKPVPTSLQLAMPPNGAQMIVDRLRDAGYVDVRLETTVYDDDAYGRDPCVCNTLYVSLPDTV